MSERIAAVAAAFSAALGGVTIASTRLVAGAADPIVVNTLRFGMAFAVLLVIALVLRVRWPRREDWLPIAALGLLAFVVFSLLFVEAMKFTVAARGGVVFSTMPLYTMLIAAMLGVQRLTLRRSLGVFIAIGSVMVALVAGLGSAPPGAWRGDLIMMTAVVCMAVYVVICRSVILRCDPLAFLTLGMGIAEVVLIALALGFGDLSRVAAFGAAEWSAMVFLGTGGGAAMFLLWVFALGRTGPTQVAVSVAVNPIVAAIASALMLGEPVGPSLLIGLGGVLAGLWIANSESENVAAVTGPA
ncbi:MAG: DMT family transporter [Rhizobiales bacterium]|nr:DMT family transporter [Hyphomicrobiales bacterium]